MKRRDILSLIGTSLLGGAAAAWPHDAHAQPTTPAWPQRVVRIIVPYVPGGGTDAIARILAAGLSQSAGYQIIIENKGGGSTNIGTEAVAHAAPDGYTILFCSLSFAINRFLFPTLGYDALADFAPVSLIASYPDLMVVPNSSPAKSVAEFIAYAKANGGKTTFASPGTGSSPHLAGELFKRRAGIEMTHIPYRGAGPAVTDVIAGRVDVIFNTLGSTLALVREHQLRGLAVTSANRFPAAPELPSVAEAALPGFDVSAWYALYVPAHTPPDVIRKLNADVVAVLADPAIHDKMEQLGVALIGSTPQQLDHHLRAEIDLWGPVIKAANIRGE
jgi:tripartite-type tricarboxylate transporter receptor subunit TctC